MNQQVIQLHGVDRASLVQRGRRLEYFTEAYNSVEGLIAIVARLVAGSIALVGFGFDSIIEVTSGLTLIWRLNADVRAEQRERVEMVALRIVGICFLALALYVSYDSIKSLIQRNPPHESVPGIILAAASLIVMPLLVRAKRRIARGISSGAMAADAKQTEVCNYLSQFSLVDCLLNAYLKGFRWEPSRLK